MADIIIILIVIVLMVLAGKSAVKHLRERELAAVVAQEAVLRRLKPNF